MIGMGAANVATYRLLKAAGLDPAAIVACDSKGTLHKGRGDIEERQGDFEDKWRVCRETNPQPVIGGIDAAMRGADVCIAFSRSGPGVISPDCIRAMAPDPIVFACANPVPEIWPDAAVKAGARVVATGRGDFPNQLNNSLVFPAMFRGVLDVRASSISEGMCIAAARELARCAEERGVHPGNILPAMDQSSVIARVAATVGVQAQAEGLALYSKSKEELYASAMKTIADARRSLDVLVREGVIPSN
jgi:malate dehydrogenase (oxaloacetate-decarboxylating)